MAPNFINTRPTGLRFPLEPGRFYFNLHPENLEKYPPQPPILKDRKCRI